MQITAGDAAAAPIPRVGVAQRLLPRWQLGGTDAVDVSSLQVIGQADRKYIMCQAGGVLVAIDQHAADERARLEGYFDDLCAMLVQLSRLSEGQPASAAEGVSVLMPAVPVALSRHDAAAVGRVAAGLRQLGIQLAPKAADTGAQGEGDRCVLHMVCAPTALVPRLVGREGRSEGFAVELLLAAAEWLASGAQGSTYAASRSCAADEGLAGAWPALAALPGVVVDTVRSMACRGAITFNESLSLSECRAVVDRLAQCQFPWFCAHGRRSTAPIAPLAWPESIGHSHK
ncbi:DNA mismatch repair protein [Coemansia biformis]|uniref:DNA mismatch repair protein n=1 Tax=Coemansia biformis TaxID=1286918 RepID=A0A9W7YG22_9FUNG|nr:DNA mismatch repair protein [Coemansia biformis]